MSHRYKVGDFVSLLGSVYEVLTLHADAYVLQLRGFRGEEIADGASLSFPLHRQTELLRAAWPRTRTYRGYVIELQETYSGFRAHARLGGEDPGHAPELVAGVIGEDPDEVLARMREIIDDELGTDGAQSSNDH